MHYSLKLVSVESTYVDFFDYWAIKNYFLTSQIKKKLNKKNFSKTTFKNVLWSMWKRITLLIWSLLILCCTGNTNSKFVTNSFSKKSCIHKRTNFFSFFFKLATCKNFSFLKAEAKSSWKQKCPVRVFCSHSYGF